MTAHSKEDNGIHVANYLTNLTKSVYDNYNKCNTALSTSPTIWWSLISISPVQHKNMFKGTGQCLWYGFSTSRHGIVNSFTSKLLQWSRPVPSSHCQTADQRRL